MTSVKSLGKRSQGRKHSISAKIERDSYVHSNMRLKTRYDMEITFEQYKELCVLFRCKSSEIKHLKANHVGDLEGWVMLNDQWVCGYYSTRQHLIKTFMPKPPDFNLAYDMQKVEKEIAERSSREIEEYIKAHKLELKNILLEEKIRKEISDRSSAEVQRILQRRGLDSKAIVEAMTDDAYRQDLAWYSKKFQSVSDMLCAGKFVEAYELVRAIAQLPSTVRPSVDCTDDSLIFKKSAYQNQGMPWTIEDAASAISKRREAKTADTVTDSDADEWLRWHNNRRAAE